MRACVRADGWVRACVYVRTRVCDCGGDWSQESGRPSVTEMKDAHRPRAHRPQRKTSRASGAAAQTGLRANVTWTHRHDRSAEGSIATRAIRGDYWDACRVGRVGDGGIHRAHSGWSSAAGTATLWFAFPCTPRSGCSTRCTHGQSRRLAGAMSSDFARSACAGQGTQFAQGWAVSAREQSKFGIRGGPQDRLAVTGCRSLSEPRGPIGTDLESGE